MQPLDITYLPNLLKQKTKFLLHRFLLRFFTPTIFILWLLVSLQIDSCDYNVYIIFTLSFVAAIHSSYVQYTLWYHKILHMVERPTISMLSKVMVIIPDFFIHMLTSFLGFWWVDDMHTCFRLDKSHQGGLWIILFLVALTLHVIHHNYIHANMNLIVQRVYQHVDSSTV